jgi:tetratricopeptide (TPR) repeat protein
MIKTPFVGRRDLLKEINDTIENKETAILLKGPEGVGKTTIIKRITTRLKKKKFTPLYIRGTTSPEAVLQEIAQKAAENNYHEAAELFTAQIEYKEKLEKVLENYVFKTNLLLMFDDFDQNQTAEGHFKNERLKELLTYLKDTLKEKETGSLLLLTSQQNIENFTTIEVPPLAQNEFLEMIPDSTALHRMDKKSLKQLYFDIGGYPRAILMIDQIAKRIFESGNIDWAKLKERIPKLDERIRYKESETADFTYLLIEPLVERMSRKQSRLLDAMSIYRGKISTSQLSVQQLEFKPNDLKKLEQSHLVTPLGSGQYEIPAVVARNRQSRMEEPEKRQYHLTAAENLRSLSKNGTQKIEPNHHETLWHYQEAGEYNTAASIIFEMDQYYCHIGFPQYAFDLLTGIEKHAGEMSESNRLKLHNRLTTMYSIFGKLDDALKQNEAALIINEATDNKEGIAVNQGQMGLLYEARGKLDDALKHYKMSLTAAEETNNNDAVLQRLEKIGAIEKQLGHYDNAEKEYRRALEINKEKNNQKAIASNLEQLGRIHDEQGKFDDALEFYRQSLEIKEKIVDPQGCADILHQVGNVNYFRGNIDEALTYYLKSLEIKENIEDHKGTGYSLGQIGLIYQRKGKENEALENLKKSLESFEKADEKKGIAAGNHQIGRILESKGDKDTALEHYQKAVQIREELGDMLGAAITYGQLGMLHYSNEDYETALLNSTKAYAIFARYGSPNQELARRNMLRIKPNLPTEKFNQVLREYNIEPGPHNNSQESKQ